MYNRSQLCRMNRRKRVYNHPVHCYAVIVCGWGPGGAFKSIEKYFFEWWKNVVRCTIVKTITSCIFYPLPLPTTPQKKRKTRGN